MTDDWGSLLMPGTISLPRSRSSSRNRACASKNRRSVHRRRRRRFVGDGPMDVSRAAFHCLCPKNSAAAALVGQAFSARAAPRVYPDAVSSAPCRKPFLCCTFHPQTIPAMGAQSLHAPRSAVCPVGMVPRFNRSAMGPVRTTPQKHPHPPGVRSPSFRPPPTKGPPRQRSDRCGCAQVLIRIENLENQGKPETIDSA